jgi:hypothetical protein
MSDFIEQFKADKGVRDLIKRKVLTSQDLRASWRYDSHDLNFRITHIKRHSEWSTSLFVNVAVSGGLKGWGWITDENGLCNINNTRDFRSAISRNREIRRFVEKSVAHELKLFGIKSWEVNIGKLNIKESI